MPRKSDDPFYSHELPGLDGLNAASANCQHEEHVYATIEKEGMGLCDKTIYILQKGSDVQRTTALDHLKHCFSECTGSEITKIIAELNNGLWQLEVKVQVAAATAIIDAIPSMLPDSVSELVDLTETMIQLNDDKSRSLWLDVYVSILHHVSSGFAEQEMVSRTLKKGGLSEPQHSRTLCCRLIGAFCERDCSPSIINQFIDKSIPLCQDTDLTVRAAMCQQLCPLAKAVGHSATRDTIMAEMLELLRDEEDAVSRTAFETLIEMLSFLEPTYRKQQIYPVIRNHVKDPPSSIQGILVQNFGKYIWSVKADLVESGDEDITIFLKRYVGQSVSNDAAVRKHCAYNLPAVCATVPIGYYTTKLHAVTVALSEDSCCSTRCSIAAGLHELVRILDHKSFSLFSTIFTNLITDKEPIVRDTIIVNLSSILNNFSANITDSDESEQYFTNLIPPIVQWWESHAPRSLAKLQIMYSHVDYFPHYFSVQQLHSVWLPLFIKQLSQGPRAFLSDTARTVIHFSRHLQNSSLEGELLTSLINDFGKSKSYPNRLSFIEICKHLLTYYSRKYFRERVLETILELSKDPVSAVRRRLVLLLPAIRKTLNPPADVDYLSNFIKIIATLQLDTNPEVIEAVTVVAAEIEELNKELIENPNPEEDRIDAVKEQEELVLREAAMEQDKLDRRTKIREMIQHEKVAKTESGSGRNRTTKRVSDTSSNRLPPAPSGGVVRQPVGGSRITGITKGSEKKKNSRGSSALANGPAIIKR
eukprot:TRINITY_DN20775_c0_g1_i1.p1 TRINITY_DN20775_c0_g1~~TRINITY_DN20775_c0_g1_i1.p1  ORF type:complete len:760 (+),score=123.76 TRINITY_DN20775_c0_g1_i1:163-2442(+)